MSEPMKVMVRDFADCSVLIVGGTSGVGMATAIQLVDSGVRRIALVGRNAERGEQARQRVLAAAPDAKVMFVQGDANRVDQAQRIVAEAHAGMGSIDTLVNATIGVYTPDPLMKIPIEDIEPIILSVVMAPMLMCKLVLPLMAERKGGAIINIASDAAKVPTPGETVLGAAMSAIVVFSRTLAMEAKRNGIRVNVLTPSLIEGTPTAARNQASGFSAKLFAKIKPMAQLGVATPEDLASLIVYLASPAAGRLTGQTISVNGGVSAG
ncbi:SDR family NAD(P)-dependent oxidoreductase [Polycyclovorans algicola]|uniref:SDR family NAD(P)-dependent oxidoreductase n=1 Tax=Polycyclovorans algicola TaxID=616992 RepID=UPI0004A77260|nr:SDR family oxidoreductase [Polycyclovorans algicola]